MHFDPGRDCTYADRIRRREPGDRSLGLSAHVDAGSVERWIDPAYRKVYRHVFSGDWRAFDPFDGAWRPEAEEIPSPAVCSMFRTWQGWTALTPQGEGDGTLQLLPIARGIVYLLLRALQDDVPGGLAVRGGAGAGAVGRRGVALAAPPRAHPIPRVEAGDTVWWHPDIGHGVEDVNRGTGYSNVVYAGAAPACPKNAAYLARQKEAFLEGRSAPDFAPEDYEVDFEGRATIDDLTDLGPEADGDRRLVKAGRQAPSTRSRDRRSSSRLRSTPDRSGSWATPIRRRMISTPAKRRAPVRISPPATPDRST